MSAALAPQRPAALQGFVTALSAAFDGAPMTEPARDLIARAFAAAARPAAPGSPAPETLPVTTLLPAALAPLLPRADAIGALAHALETLAPVLPWTARKSIGPSASPGFATAHANAYLLGPGALEERADLWIGLSLMAPHARYPDHDHAPEEAYLALSPGAFWHEDRRWITPGIGGTVHNAPGIRHAMRAGEAPFLAVWVLKT